MPARFIDSHAHLDGEQLNPHLDEILARAKEVGLTEIICVGASAGFESNERTLKVAQAHEHLYATVGIHPHDAKLTDDEVVERLREMADDEKVVAIGETGLDYYYDLSPREAQRESFRRFLRLAKEKSLPVVVHTRDAEEDTVEIMQEEGAAQIGGVIHCFTGTEALSVPALKMGFYISFSGVLTFRNADRLRAIARDLPRDRVLVETDCPFLTPAPHRGKTNEPAMIVHTAQKLAELWEEDLETVKARTGENAARLFKL